jgi:catechol 2,3-dioxygenase-like lactoylglutathione lyase family enzyme
MRILGLQLQTPDVAAQLDFYHGVFGLHVSESSEHKILLQAGATKLSFVRSHHILNGIYHFAFTIPENKFSEAVGWLRQRMPLISDASGRDTFHSDAWNADMVYLYDPAGNVVEFIARHTLPSSTDHVFSGQRVLCISEIGVASGDVRAEAKALARRAMTSIYSGAESDEFAAVGDETGLLIVVRRGRIWFPDTGQAAEPVPIAVIVETEEGPRRFDFT